MLRQNLMLVTIKAGSILKVIMFNYFEYTFSLK